MHVNAAVLTIINPPKKVNSQNMAQPARTVTVASGGEGCLCVVTRIGPVQPVGGGVGSRDPGMLEALMAREAAARVQDEEVGDEVLSPKRYLVPVRGVEPVRSGTNLPDEHGAGFAEKGREAAQQTTGPPPARNRRHALGRGPAPPAPRSCREASRKRPVMSGMAWTLGIASRMNHDWSTNGTTCEM
jgi:hypothetical protein